MAVRANQLTNFRGEPYVTRPELEDIIGGDLGNLLAIKPFTFSAKDMTPDNSGGLSVVIPGIIFNVFRSDTKDISYGDLTYLDGNDAGKTRFTISNYEGEGIVIDNEGDNSTPFVAYAFVKPDGTPLTVLPSAPLNSNNG